jgi:phospholipid/cholesterol/gamma-HCH transport system ATP-binding protein
VIAPQTSLVIIGGSGTGKSVTIKSILGIIRPDEGTILVDGEDITHINGAARDRVMKKFGMLFQGAALFDSLAVWENVAFGLIQGRGMARSRARDIAIQKLAKVGLTEDVAFLSPSERPAKPGPTATAVMPGRSKAFSTAGFSMS